MKNTFLFTLVCSSFFSLAAYAGDPNDNNIPKTPGTLFAPPESVGKKFSIGLSLGTTIPLQDYSSTTAVANDSTHVVGYAKTGIHFNATVAYKFSKYVGAMLMAGGSTNAYNSSGAGPAGSSAVIKPSGPHYLGQYFIGPYFSYPIGKKLSIEVRALAGIITSKYPEIGSTTTESFSGPYIGTSSSKVSTDVKIKSGMAFGYSGGIGAKYMLSEHIAVTLNAAYSGSNMVYKSLTTTISESATGYLASFVPNYNGSTTSTTTRHMAIGMINITGGIAYCF